MNTLRTALIICCVFFIYEVCAITEEEKKVALAIKDKLNELTKFTTFAAKRGMSGRGIGIKKTALSGQTTQYLDFQLLVDSSGSIGAKSFEDAKEATMTIVDFIQSRAPLSSGGSRAALIEFSSPRLTKLVFGLPQHHYAWDVKSQIKKLRYDSGPSTATALALRKAKTEFQQNPSSSNAKVIWALTDGKSNSQGSPVTPANELKRMGVTICAMAIGKSVNMAEINNISSSGCVYKAKTFSSYKRIMKYAFKSRNAGSPGPVLTPGFFKGIKF